MHNGPALVIYVYRSSKNSTAARPPLTSADREQVKLFLIDMSSGTFWAFSLAHLAGECQCHLLLFQADIQMPLGDLCGKISVQMYQAHAQIVDHHRTPVDLHTNTFVDDSALQVSQ